MLIHRALDVLTPNAVNHSTAVADAVDIRVKRAVCLAMTSSLGAICESRIKIIHRLKCEMHHVAVVHAVV